MSILASTGNQLLVLLCTYSLGKFSEFVHVCLRYMFLSTERSERVRKLQDHLPWKWEQFSAGISFSIFKDCGRFFRSVPGWDLGQKRETCIEISFSPVKIMEILMSFFQCQCTLYSVFWIIWFLSGKKKLSKIPWNSLERLLHKTVSVP